jgi:hypothetical protein
MTGPLGLPAQKPFIHTDEKIRRCPLTARTSGSSCCPGATEATDAPRLPSAGHHQIGPFDAREHLISDSPLRRREGKSLASRHEQIVWRVKEPDDERSAVTRRRSHP